MTISRVIFQIAHVPQLNRLDRVLLIEVISRPVSPHLTDEFPRGEVEVVRADAEQRSSRDNLHNGPHTIRHSRERPHPLNPVADALQNVRHSV